MQSARAASRRAQFQLWIFSYATKRWSSRIKIDPLESRPRTPAGGRANGLAAARKTALFGHPLWLSRTSGPGEPSVGFLQGAIFSRGKGLTMKKILVATMATLAVLSLAACAGNSPKAPPPIVTKG